MLDLISSARSALRTGGTRIGLLGLVPYPAGIAPSQRYRIEQWSAVLAERGIDVELRPFVDETLMRRLHHSMDDVGKAVGLAAALVRRLFTVASTDRYDVVYVHRAAAIVGPAIVERLIRLRRPMIFDFDDAIFLTHTTRGNREFGWLKFSGKTAAICAMSRHVTVGNEYLAAFARRYNRQVTVVPSSVDIERYRPGPLQAHNRVVIGWMGTATSQTHLELFVPMLRELARQRDVVIRVVSDRRPEFDGVPIDWRGWSAANEVEELRGFDVGIMPMPNDAWAQGKCAMKALLCMAVGVPVVCSAVGVNREVIEHGENGFLATSDADWITYLVALAADAALRARIGAAGRATVEGRYSMHRSAAAFASVVERVVNETRRPRLEVRHA